MIAIIDYGIGNLKSVVKAFQFLDIPVKLTANFEKISTADGVVLPGVGAFGAGMSNLQENDMVTLIEKIVSRGTPLLGICLGMQLLFSESAEAPGVPGLGLIPGRVERFTKNEVHKIPHIGWNQVEQRQDDPLFKKVKEQANFYFVHSYYAVSSDNDVIIGTTEYGKREFVSIVRQLNVWGFQCHPEKSSRIGLQVLKNFSEVIINGSNTGG